MMEILPHISYTSTKPREVVLFTAIKFDEEGNGNNDPRTDHVSTLLQQLGSPISSHSTYSTELKSEESLESIIKGDKDDVLSSEIELSQESVESDDSINSVKNQLKNSILKRRQMEGKEDIKIEFKDPEPLQMTSEELKKREQRKAQNRLSARKCRQKKSTNITKLKSEITVLESMQRELRQLYDFLSSEKNVMESLLRLHSKCDSFHCNFMNDEKQLDYFMKTSSFCSEIQTKKLQEIKRKYSSRKMVYCNSV